MSKLKDHLFYTGVIIFSQTLIAERLFSIETNHTCLLKGFGCGLEMIGIAVLMKKKRKEYA
jgi:hypothetical protein